MFDTVNEAFAREKRRIHDDDLIVESVLGTTDVMEESDDEMEDVVDVDSIPSDVYQKVDAELDRIVSSGEYDDTSVEEMVDGEAQGEEIDVIIDEAATEMEKTMWEDDENIGHPDKDRRNERGDKKDCHCQPEFEPEDM